MATEEKSTKDLDADMKDLHIKEEQLDDEGSGDNDAEMEDPEPESTKKTKSDQIHNLEVLKMVKEAQQARGLRHGDYVRYRQYCTKRLHRVRKSLSFPQGTRTRFHGKAVKADHINDARFLQIPLFLAERAWSYGMQLKQESGPEHPRKKFHMIRRLSKAATLAANLYNLCENIKVDARTKLETEAYCEWMRGVLFFNKESWKEALESFSHSKAIYESIASTLDEDTRALYRQRIDETVPQIRFCGYNIGDESAVEDLIKMRLKPGSAGLGEGVMAKLDELIAQSREKQSVTEISWIGKTIPVKNSKIRGLLISAQEGIKQLDAIETADGKLEVLENTLNILREALQTTVEELKAAGKEQQSGQISGIQLLHSYITFLKNRQSSQRALLTIQMMKNKVKVSPEKEAEEKKKKHKPQDFIRLYDTIVENNTETASLPGVAGTVLIESLNAETLLYKAFRAMYIANAFVGVRKFPEAMTFFDRAADFHQQSKKAFAKLETNETGKQDLTELDGLITSQKESAMTLNVLQKEEFADVESEILTRYRKAGATEIDLPPPKPFTFDLVLDAIKLPSLDDRISAKKTKTKAAVSTPSAAKEPEKATAGAAGGAGIGSTIKGLLGWGSKKS